MADSTLEPGGLDARAEAGIWFARGIGLVAGGLVVIAVAAALVGAARVLLLVFFAVLVASALSPLVDWLRRTPLPIGRRAAILVVYLAFFASVAAIGFVLVPIVIGQAGQLLDQLPAVFNRVLAWSQTLQPPEVATSVGALVTAAQGALTGGSTPSTNQVVSAGLGVADTIVSVVTILALVFFWMTERQRLQRFGLSFLPPERHGGVRQAWNMVEFRLGGWVRGQLLLMLALGVMTGVAYTVMGCHRRRCSG